jgi:RNA polymerase sigma factor for flagellar operon FliA
VSTFARSVAWVGTLGTSACEADVRHPEAAGGRERGGTVSRPAPPRATGAAETVASLWQRWRVDRDPEARDLLVLAHAPLVKYVVGRMNLGRSAVAEPEDLVSFGIFGLLQAIDRYDPECGYSFTTFAFPRIRGAVLDELRRLDWVPRTVRAQTRAPAGDTPATGLAAGAHGTRPRARRLEPVAALGEGEAPATDTPDASGHDSMLAVENHLLVEQLLATLDDAERQVVRAYYFDGRSLVDIGRQLGVTESRVSQILRSIRERLAEVARAAPRRA